MGEGCEYFLVLLLKDVAFYSTMGRGDTVVGLDGDKGKIKNTQGTELPNTGGPGTTVLYFLGSMITSFAGVGLVMRRRRNVA